MSETTDNAAGERGCDCDRWHGKHRWHCASNYPATPDADDASEPMSDEHPYARMTFAEVLDDYVLVRGDLSAEYARKQLVREHASREAAAATRARAEGAEAALAGLREGIEARVAEFDRAAAMEFPDDPHDHYRRMAYQNAAAAIRALLASTPDREEER